MKNLSFKDAKIIKGNGQLIVIENIEGNIVERDFVKEFLPYINIEGLNIKLTKKRATGGGRKPTAKYVCPKCGRKVSSSSDDLLIKCMSCGVEFTKPE